MSRLCYNRYYRMKKVTDFTLYTGIVSDFDATLAGSDSTINKPVVEEVRKWMAAGKSFSIATGRQFTGIIQRSARELGLTAPQIVRGGAEIVDPLTGKVLHAELMPDDDARALVELLLTKDYDMWVEKDETIYTPGGLIVANYDAVPFADLTTLVVHQIPKIHIRPCDDSEKVAYVENELINRFPKLHFIRLHNKRGKSWDVTASTATKHMAVFRLAELLNTTPSQLIGMGDGYNDFSLLTACGYKVVMGNAVEELLPLADMVTKTVSEDGVAFAIKTFLDC